MTTYSSILAWKVLWTEEPTCYSPWDCKESETTERMCGTVGEDICPVNASQKTFCHPNIARSSRFFLFWKKKKKLEIKHFFLNARDFSSGPVVKNPPCNVGDMGSAPGWRTGIPHAEQQLSPCAATTGAFTPMLGSVPQTKDPTWCNEDLMQANK